MTPTLRFDRMETVKVEAWKPAYKPAVGSASTGPHRREYSIELRGGQ